MRLVERVFGKRDSHLQMNAAIESEASLLIIASKLAILSETQRNAIARFNDQARLQLGEGCTLCTTSGFLELYTDDQDQIVTLIKEYDASDIDSNMYNECDFCVIFKLNDALYY
jgi:hypothetical protein